MAIRIALPLSEAPLSGDGRFHQSWTGFLQSVTDRLAGLGSGAVDGSEAAVGEVGEFVTSVVASGGAVSLADATPEDVTSITLTAGDWDVWGAVVFAATGAHNIIAGWMSAASATLPGDLSDGGYSSIRATFTSGATQALQAGRIRVSVATTGPIFLSALAGFSTGVMTAYGSLNARRMR